MEEVLIVAKTRMGPGKACVGGLNLSTCKNVRLRLPGDNSPPVNTPFEVGQVWTMNLRSVTHPTPPHVEDKIFTNHNYIASYPSLRSQLLQYIQPWKGGLTQLFDGYLQGDGRKVFISRSGGLPSCSTGYWLTTIPLTLICAYGKAYYTIDSVARKGQEFYRSAFSICYVGFAEPLPEIPANTLVRVSLARWWRKEEHDEERCHLQISGWYL
jgi:hypothetical protein